MTGKLLTVLDPLEMVHLLMDETHVRRKISEVFRRDRPASQLGPVPPEGGPSSSVSSGMGSVEEWASA